MPMNPTTGEPEHETRVVHVIRSSYHYEDSDRRRQTDETVMEDEGWFDDAESAAARCEQLNAQPRRLYEVQMDRGRRERQSKIDAALSTNAEVEILRANGMDRKPVPVPSPFVPTPFDEWFPESCTTYSVETMSRSEHDGIARADHGSRSTD